MFCIVQFPFWELFLLPHTPFSISASSGGGQFCHLSSNLCLLLCSGQHRVTINFVEIWIDILNHRSFGAYISECPCKFSSLYGKIESVKKCVVCSIVDLYIWQQHMLFYLLLSWITILFPVELSTIVYSIQF